MKSIELVCDIVEKLINIIFFDLGARFLIWSNHDAEFFWSKLITMQNVFGLIQSERRILITQGFSKNGNILFVEIWVNYFYYVMDS